jgi:hypothetical protein
MVHLVFCAQSVELINFDFWESLGNCESSFGSPYGNVIVLMENKSNLVTKMLFSSSFIMHFTSS